MSLNDWWNRNRDRKSDSVEYYEDTHNERGEYIGNASEKEFLPYNRPAGEARQTPDYSRRDKDNMLFEQAAPSYRAGYESRPVPDESQPVSPKLYQNIVVYYPQTPEDVQALIDYLKRREPAIVNLDDVQPDVAQRILDFLSGATYGLDGSVHRISGNIFLLSPKGVEITVPYAQK